MKEIGGQFALADCLPWLSRKTNSFDHLMKDYHGEFYNSGRTCLQVIASQLAPGRVLLPSYLCKSVSKPFFEAPHLEIVFVPLVSSTLHLDLAFVLKSIGNGGISGLLLIDYFGMSDPHQDQLVKACRRAKVPLIHDLTHSWLDFYPDLPLKGDYILISLRKTLPLADGALFLSKFPCKPSFSWKTKCLASLSSYLRLFFMAIKSVQWLKPLWYRGLKFHEQLLDSYTPCGNMTWASSFLLSWSDLDSIQKRRKANCILLSQALPSSLLLYPHQNLTFSCPLRLKTSVKRNRLHQELVKNFIYCPIHWVLEECIEDSTAQSVSSIILSLPVDQRYREKDMKVIVSIVACL